MRTGTSRLYAPWTPLQLETKWNNYMDQVFQAAKDKGTNFIEVNIQRLKNEFTDPKKLAEQKEDPKDTQKKKDEKKAKRAQQAEMKVLIEKLEAAWNAPGVKNWQKPW
jgi:arabinogalactan endo-1,4-beta-galactosidase